MNLKGASWGLLVETMRIRKSLIHSIRIALCDNLELPGTRVILEKRALIRVNFDHFYYIGTSVRNNNSNSAATSLTIGGPEKDPEDPKKSKLKSKLLQNKKLKQSSQL